MTKAQKAQNPTRSKGCLGGKRLLAADVPATLIKRMNRLAVGLMPDECWNWPRVNRGGYAQWDSSINGKKFVVRVARHAYALANGELKEGDLVRHTCDNPRCFNPDHLVAGTQADNMQDMIKRGRGQFAGTTHEERRAMIPWVLRGAHVSSMPVIDGSGAKWPSIRAAADGHGLTATCISYRCRQQIKGWRFA